MAGGREKGRQTLDGGRAIPLLDEVMDERAMAERARLRREVAAALEPLVERLAEDVARRAARQFRRKLHHKLLEAMLAELPAMIDRELDRRHRG